MKFHANGTSESDANVVITPGGAGSVLLEGPLRTGSLRMANDTLSTTVQDGNVVLAPAGDGAVVVQNSSLRIDSLTFDGANISTMDSDLNLIPGGNAHVVIPSKLTVGQLTVAKNEVSTEGANTPLTLTASGDGSVVVPSELRVHSLSITDSNISNVNPGSSGDIELAPAAGSKVILKEAVQIDNIHLNSNFISTVADDLVLAPAAGARVVSESPATLQNVTVEGSSIGTLHSGMNLGLSPAGDGTVMVKNSFGIDYLRVNGSGISR